MALFGKNITRRSLLKAGGATGVAVATVSILAGCKHKEQEESAPVVIDADAADYVIDPNTNESNYSYEENLPEPTASFDIAVGNVLHPSSGASWIAVTTAGSSASPMVKGSAFSPITGALTEVVSLPVAKDINNVVVYDVRCSDSVYAWIELNILTHDWTLYASAFADGALVGTPTSLWTGDSDFDPALFAVSGNKVIWQVMPAISGSKTTEHSFCYVWSLGDTSAQAAVESPGRFATEPAVSGTTVTLVPRVNADEGTFYGITAYSLTDNLATQIDQLVLPQSVRPLNAVRIGSKFAFSIEANFSSGGLFANMGTYIGSNADGEKFVALSREPSAAVAGKEGLYLIKSRASYFLVDTKARSYTIVTAANRCVDYGEYPASVGETSTFVTYSTVKEQDTGYPSNVVVRTFSL